MSMEKEIEDFMQNFLNQQQEAKKLVDLRLEKAYREKKQSVKKEIKDKTRYFKNILLDNDFSEASHFVEHKLWKWKYYKITSEDVAFIVNLEAYKDYILIYYGYSSTAFTKLKGSENTLKENGVDSCDITIRNVIKYKINDNEEIIKSQIKDFYIKYLSVSKEEVLNLKKEKQKEFINKINIELKPLGLKKNNTLWRKYLDNNLCVEFYLQKSAYSDEYYFNITLYYIKPSNEFCYYTRINTNNKGIYDWQTLHLL